MSTTEDKKPRYRMPSVSAVCDVRIDEFDTKDIISYLRHKGYRVDGTGDEPDLGGGCDGSSEAIISRSELNRISTLALCGQREQARDMVMQMVSEAIGRSL